MIKLLACLLTIISAFCFAQTQPFAPGQSLPAGKYTVTRAIDGDTVEITVEGVKRSVRTIGTNSPERGQPYYAEAKQFLADLVTNQIVTVVPGVEPVDRFGRVLGYVLLEEHDVALMVAQAGFAQVLTVRPNDAFSDIYKVAVAGARAARKGIHANAPRPSPEVALQRLPDTSGGAGFFRGRGDRGKAGYV